MHTAVDTNVISALWSNEPLASQAARALGEARDAGGLTICGPVYAELHAHPHADHEFVRRFLDRAGIYVDFELSVRVWNRVSEAFGSYAMRRRESDGGKAKRLLVDFIIGAHAQVGADQLLTMDPARYRTYFEDLRLTVP